MLQHLNIARKRNLFNVTKVFLWRKVVVMKNMICRIIFHAANSKNFQKTLCTIAEKFLMEGILKTLYSWQEEMCVSLRENESEWSSVCSRERR